MGAPIEEYITCSQWEAELQEGGWIALAWIPRTKGTTRYTNASVIVLDAWETVVATDSNFIRYRYILM